MRKGIIGLIVLIIVAVGGYQAYSYWNSTYNGKTAYAIVPTAVKEKSKNSDGSNYKINGKQVYHFDYDFTWAEADGTVKHVAWESAESTNPKPLPEGAYVTAQVSAKRVTEGMRVIDKSAVPAKALKAIQ